MIVTDIYVKNREIFIDMLIRKLIKEGRSYVKIENEIHFDNYILRIYEIELKFFSEIDIDETDKILFNLLKKEELFENLTYVNENSKIEINNVPTLNKRLIKHQNKIINKKINTSKK